MMLSAYSLPALFKLSTISRYNLQPSKAKNLILKLAPISLCLGLSSFTHMAQAQLPAPIQKALNQANINSEDISLIILPINNSSDTSILKPTASSNTITLNDEKALKEDIATQSNILNNKAKNTPILSGDKLSSSTLAIAMRERIEALNSQTKNNLSKNNLSKNSQSKNSQIEHTSNRDNQTLNLTQNSLSNNPKKSSNVASVKDIKKPTPLSSAIYHRPNISRTPASTMKLIPTFIALDLLGPDFVWSTEVFYTGYVAANTLYGDLIIKGSGDPKLTYQRLAKLLEEVKLSGIHHIKGNIILDSSIFKGVGKNPAAFDNAPLRPYNASPDGLLINFNSIELTTLPLFPNSTNSSKADKFAKVLYSPMLADFRLPNRLPIRNSGRCSKISSSLAPTWENKELKFNKGLPQSCGEHSFYIAYPDPKEFAKQVVKYQWLNHDASLISSHKILGNGSTLSGTVVNIENPLYKPFYNPINKRSYLNKLTTDNDFNQLSYTAGLSIVPSSPLPFVSYPSLPLSQQIYDINHFSNNVMTEQLTLGLSVYSNSTLPKSNKTLTLASTTPSTNNNYATYPKALSVINDWWKTHLKTKPPLMTNGSGLCRNCYVTASNLAELLGYAYSHPNFMTYLDSLGVAGISGTIVGHADRHPNSAAIGRAWIKTGTLKNVTSMAGYVHGQSGQDYIVVGIINNTSSDTLNTYEARGVLDTMLDWTAQH